jgi:hypothetical protein
VGLDSKLGPLGTSAIYWPIVPAPGDCEDGEFGGINGRGNWSTRRKPAPAPLCPPQIPLDQTWGWTRAAAVGSQRLTASAMARPWCRVCTVHAFLSSKLRKSEWSSRSGRVISWDREPCTYWIEECMDHGAMEKRIIFCPYREANQFRRLFILNVHFKLIFKKSSRFIRMFLTWQKCLQSTHHIRMFRMVSSCV